VKGLTLSVLPGRFAVCRLDPGAGLPAWALEAGEGFLAVSRTPEETSVVCPEALVPPGTTHEGGWRAIKVEGPLDFALTGVLVSVAAPLAEAEVPIFAVSTYDTDYVLVRKGRLEDAVEALVHARHEVRR
jgi:hypothetical protein